MANTPADIDDDVLRIEQRCYDRKICIERTVGIGGHDRVIGGNSIELATGGRMTTKTCSLRENGSGLWRCNAQRLLGLTCARPRSNSFFALLMSSGEGNSGYCLPPSRIWNHGALDETFTWATGSLVGS